MQLKNNIRLTLRERGKIKHRWEGQNIWLDAGREWLAELISYSAYSPLTPVENRRVGYVGFGIGGFRQTNLLVANNPPFSVDYPGTNIQTDMDPGVNALERPVCVTAGVYLAELPPPDISSTYYYAKYTLSLGLSDVSFGSYLTVPLSEVALFHSGADPFEPDNQPLSYEAFESLPKTQAMTLDVDWSVRF